LLEAGARIQAYDPEAMPATRQQLGDNPAMTYAASSYEALEGADALIVCTEWTKFREPDFERMHSLMKAPVIFDGRNLYNPAKLANLGFTYFHIGQKIEA
jgi:UDPglucose 6-dehydrogenase